MQTIHSKWVQDWSRHLLEWHVASSQDVAHESFSKGPLQMRGNSAAVTWGKTPNDGGIYSPESYRLTATWSCLQKDKNLTGLELRECLFIKSNKWNMEDGWESRRMRVRWTQHLTPPHQPGLIPSYLLSSLGWTLPPQLGTKHQVALQARRCGQDHEFHHWTRPSG